MASATLSFVHVAPVSYKYQSIMCPSIDKLVEAS